MIAESFLQRQRGTLATKVFNDNFEVIRADTPDLREICYALRYEIFCKERGFDMDCTPGRETDAYDEHAICFLIRYRHGDRFIGTGRLILSDEKKPMDSLPIQKYLGSQACAAFGLDNEQGVSQTCEVSRLGILKQYASNDADAYSDTKSIGAALFKRHIANLSKLGLYRAIFDFALNHAKRPNCVFTTDPFLLRRFRQIGFQGYNVMGEDLDIYGAVTPVHFNIPHLLEKSRNAVPVNWAVVTDNGRILNAASAA